MKGVAFVSTLLVISAFGKSFLEDISPPKLGRRLPLSGRKLVGKVPFHQSEGNLFSRKSVKKLLSKTVLKQLLFSKLNILDLALAANSNSLKSDVKQNTIKEQQGITAGKKTDALALPKLIAGAPKPSREYGAGPNSKIRKIGGYFPLLHKKVQSNSFMHVNDLQKETCLTVPYNETVTAKGCKPITKLNRICTGRCNSFFIPGSDSDFQTCASCVPSSVREEEVILKCPKKKNGVVKKTRQVILACKCRTTKSCRPLQ